jgi:hypothetical protein
MIPALLALPCDRIINPCLVSLRAVTDTEAECAWDVVIECLILQQVVSVSAFHALDERRCQSSLLTLGAPVNQSLAF